MVWKNSLFGGENRGHLAGDGEAAEGPEGRECTQCQRRCTGTRRQVLPRLPHTASCLRLAILVGSGKTSLVKSLSTLLSTASLDKSPEAVSRGITLDLGFSAFLLPLPEHLQAEETPYQALQFTLVDCPGHASLIRTIIGGRFGRITVSF